MLWLYRRVVFGRAEKPEVQELEPLNNREYLIFVPLTVLVLWFGIYPSSLLDLMEGTVIDLIQSSGIGSSTQTALR